MKEYYELFGLTESATDEEIEARYNALREKYREERWLDGEAGNEAAKMLTKLEVAYAEIKESRKGREDNTQGASAFEEISALLKEDKVAEAQARLDDFNERSAEWHYLQAVVFYKKNWTSDSKKQLEIAIQMDPDNQKYRNADGKLNAKNNYEQQEAHRREQQAQSTYSDAPNEQMGGNACSECFSCCYTYLCVNCLFNLCCGCR